MSHIAGFLVMILGIGLIFALIALFFLPTILAFKKNRSDKFFIFIINLFFGATVIGWVICLFWAMSKPITPTIIIQNSDGSQTKATATMRDETNGK